VRGIPSTTESRMLGPHKITLAAGTCQCQWQSTAVLQSITEEPKVAFVPFYKMALELYTLIQLTSWPKCFSWDAPVRRMQTLACKVSTLISPLLDELTQNVHGDTRPFCLSLSVVDGCYRRASRRQTGRAIGSFTNLPTKSSRNIVLTVHCFNPDSSNTRSWSRPPRDAQHWNSVVDLLLP
jgi:hypothetical protein